MGDLIHTLPALTDAMQAIPDLKIDWVVEPAFADIPAWHPTVNKIIPIDLRRWRKTIFSKSTCADIKKFIKTVRETQYDLIIDAQGLLKSAVVAKCARGEIHGYDKNCAREFYSSYFYDKKYFIDKTEHAVKRTRELCSRALNYTLPATRPNFHIDLTKLPRLDFETPANYFVFLHGTTWESKHYPESYWRILVEKADAKGITVYLPWGNTIEKARAERLVQHTQHAKVLHKIAITHMATFLKNAAAVVAGDTGLGHLSAALTTPTIGLYGPTDPNRVGIVGDNQFHLSAQFICAPCYSKTCWYGRKNKTTIFPSCYATMNPEKVWEILCLNYKPNLLNS